MAVQRKTLGRGLGAIISAGAKKAAESGAKKVASQAQASAPKDVKIASHGTYCEVAIEKVIPSPEFRWRQWSGNLDNTYSVSFGVAGCRCQSDTA